MSVTDNELPTHLIDPWHHLVELERRLEAALHDEGNLEGIETLATERHQCLVSCFAKLPANAAAAALHQRLLEHSLAMNQKLVSAGQEKLVDAASATTSARHNKHAMAAYHAQK